jgi:hypothetical protein
MTKSKTECKEVLDWNGHPIPGLCFRTGVNTGFKTYADEQGKNYWMNEGERDYELPFIKVSRRNENGVYATVFDSRCSLPLPA